MAFPDALTNATKGVKTGIASLQNKLGLGTWQQRLQEAKFRGVTFFYDSHDMTGGRRVVSHEFPEKNEGFTEDLGRRMREFTIAAHVLGDKYFDQRDALLNALEADGKGTLVHPYLGNIDVFVKEYTLKETQAEGRIARFDITFVLAGKPNQPDSTNDGPFALIEKALAAKQAIQDAFATAYQVSNLPNTLINAAKSKLGSFTSSVTASMTGISKNATGFSKLTAANAALSSASTLVSGNPVFNPSSLSLSIVDIMDRLGGGLGLTPDDVVFSTSRGAVQALRFFFNFDADDEAIPETTPTRIQEKEARDAINLLIQGSAAVNASAAAVQAAEDGEYLSFNDAQDDRDAIAEFLDVLMEREIDDDTYKAFYDARANLINQLPVPPDLPRLKTLTLSETEPSLVLCYDLYNDPEREQEIIDRNDIRNPLFVPGGVELEVLAE